MRIRRRYPPRRWRRGGHRKLFIFLIIVVALGFIVEWQLGTVVQAMAKSQVKQMSNAAINEAVAEELQKGDIDYSSLINIERAEDGSILAVTSNMQKMNELKSAVSLSVQSKLKDTKEREVSIALGTLIGGDLFRGRGPKIPLHISTSGSVLTNYKSSFTGAGINQTKHQIYLHIKTSIVILIPGHNVNMDIESDTLVAETVIVGAVPEFFANLDGAELASAFSK